MNLDKFSYQLPTKIIYGIDISKKVEKFIDKRKTLIITSSGFIKRDIINKIFTDKSLIVDTIHNVKSHPDFLNMENIYKEASQKGLD